MESGLWMEDEESWFLRRTYRDFEVVRLDLLVCLALSLVFFLFFFLLFYLRSCSLPSPLSRSSSCAPGSDLARGFLFFVFPES